MVRRSWTSVAGLLALVLSLGSGGASAGPADPVFLMSVNAGRAASKTKQPLLSTDFPDPAILQDADGQFYAFATSGNGKQIQAARAAQPAGPWTYIDQDMLPDSGPWTTGKDNWAPDVRRVAPGRYVMYYSGALGNDTAHHCVGAATSRAVLGPYAPMSGPWACHSDRGGAIDPSGFLDPSTGARYVVYKIDGNSIGHGGTCNNGVAPLASTPIMLQRVSADDGVTKVGDPVQILDRSDADDDGPLVEAPNIVRTPDGTYILFYSSQCFDSGIYNTKYATAKSVQGPYTRAAKPLLQTGTFNLTSPGGATSLESGTGQMLFHANCPQGRCLFEATWGLQGVNVIVTS